MFAASKTAKAAAGAAPTGDPYFPYVSLLLEDTGTNGQTNNTFLDSSTNNFTITRNGTPTQGSATPYWPNGQWGNYFNGSTDYLTMPAGSATFGTGNFTVEGWVYLTSTASSVLFDNRTLGGGIKGLQLYIDATQKLNWYDNSTLIITSSTAISLNTWTHIAAVRSGTGSGQSALYLNGAQVGTGTSTQNSSGNTTYIGRNAAVSNSFYAGYVSNFRCVTGTALYTSNFTPSTTPLTAVSGTSLLTCQSNRFKDNSSNNFAITVNGTPQVTAFCPFEPSASYTTASYGGSLQTFSTSDYVRSASGGILNVGTGDITIEGWVNFSVLGSFNAVFGPSTQNFQIDFRSGNKLYVYMAASATSGTGTTSIVTNAWYHFAVVRQSGVIKGYLNGNLEFSFANTDNLTANDTITILNYVTGTNYSYGYSSNVRVVKGTAVYTAAFTPPTAPVTAITNTSLLLNFSNAGLYDASTNNDLTTAGTAQVTTAQAKWGSGSAYFAGTAANYVSVQANPNLMMRGDFTFECWVYVPLNQVQTNYAAIYNGPGTPNQGAFTNFAGTNNFTWFGSSPAANINSGVKANDGVWHHYAAVRSGTTLTVYIDGVNKGSATVSGNIDLGSSTAARIGAGSNGASDNPFVGYIDDLRITNGYARYTANFTPPSAPFPTFGATPPPSVAEVLVVAGGGGGGGDAGGGGGAGGVIFTAAQAITGGVAYTVTVGAGGTGYVRATSTANTAGSNSVAFSTTATGGGRGGSIAGGAASSGGSGGGAYYGGTTGGSGTAGQGSNGGSITPPQGGGYGGGGGGGATAVGGTENSTTGAAGDGGAGYTSTITGSSVVYGGGGGGGGDVERGKAGGAGGTGGGGAGGTIGSVNGQNGTANRGGGGGGAANNTQSPVGAGNGGSGVVIIAYLAGYSQIKSITGLTYTMSTVSRSGYYVYTFTAGTGTITF